MTERENDVRSNVPAIWRDIALILFGILTGMVPTASIAWYTHVNGAVSRTELDARLDTRDKALKGDLETIRSQNSILQISVARIEVALDLMPTRETQPRQKKKEGP